MPASRGASYNGRIFLLNRTHAVCATRHPPRMTKVHRPMCQIAEGRSVHFAGLSSLLGSSTSYIAEWFEGSVVTGQMPPRPTAVTHNGGCFLPVSNGSP